LALLVTYRNLSCHPEEISRKKHLKMTFKGDVKIKLNNGVEMPVIGKPQARSLILERLVDNLL